MVRLFDEQCVVVGEVRDEQGVPTVSVTEPASEETDGEADAETPTACAQTETVVENPHAVAEPAATDPLPTPPVAPQAESEPSDALDLAVGTALKNAKDAASDSLQSPSDTDAPYSGHKGKSYQAQRAETCHPDNPFQVIDYVKVEGAYESDMNAPAPIHQDLIARGLAPETSFADTGYISGKNIVEAGDHGVQLLGPMSGTEPPGKKNVAGPLRIQRRPASRQSLPRRTRADPPGAVANRRHRRRPFRSRPLQRLSPGQDLSHPGHAPQTAAASAP